VRELRPKLALGHEILTSASVYAEVMVRPLQRGTDATVDAFVEAIGVTVAAIERGVARRAAEVRAHHRSLRLPDVPSLAAALASEAELLTLDSRLRRLAEQAGRARRRATSRATREHA
jgi:predicted nucleic acid-binding protein